jgi:trehalose 6-phosphate phosphatase
MLRHIAPEYPDKAPYLGLMLDYDGTLTPIVARPQEAVIASERLQLLKRLVQIPSIRIAIVSGRSIEQLADLLVTPIVLCGLHGGEIKQYPGPFVLSECPPSFAERIREFKDKLIDSLQKQNLLDRVILEDKQYSLAMHYRLTPVEDKDSVIGCLESLYNHAGSLKRDFRLQPGKQVIELVPATFSKGHCADFLMQYWQNALHTRKFSFVYAGDDLTDEYAFDAVNRQNGQSIRIGGLKDETLSSLQFDSIDKLYQELAMLACEAE